MGAENVHGCAQNAENGVCFQFLERYHKDDDEFLNHIIRTTGDKRIDNDGIHTKKMDYNNVRNIL
jgi:hypothetical protein